MKEKVFCNKPSHYVLKGVKGKADVCAEHRHRKDIQFLIDRGLILVKMKPYADGDIRCDFRRIYGSYKTEELEVILHAVYLQGRINSKSKAWKKSLTDAVAYAKVRLQGMSKSNV